ncbi:hypothetical protein JYT76_01785 [Olleya sp. AH-315-F22]|nr:hypothetical protein [Olleya sp. AH-315-F22]
MQIITKYFVLIILGFCVLQANAQDTIQNNKNASKIEILKKAKESIKTEERELLKAEVEAINKRFDKGEITQVEASKFKKVVAKKHALNIENRIAIIDNRIALLERNDYNFESEKQNVFGISISNKSYNFIREKKPIKYDIRTGNDLLFAIGFNNAIIEGESLDDSPYEIGGSGFVELGWNWTTRLFKNSNFVRLKYGFSFMWNKLDIKENKYFVNNGGKIALDDFQLNLKKAKFRTTSLVFPVYFEFGPLRKLERKTHVRYINNNKFKIGLGGFAGFNIGTMQKLKYKNDSENVKDKLKGGYNTTEFVYGLGGYIGIGDTSLYVKYNLSPIFKDQAVEQNNISLGIRFDMD